MDDLFGDTASTSSSATAAVQDEYESVLFVARESYVYKLPPRTSTAGYKAGEWVKLLTRLPHPEPSTHADSLFQGDMEAFLWKGRCRVMEISHGESSKVRIQLEDSNTGELFAQCPVDNSGKSVEPVLDSSRYFVLKVVDVNTGKHAYLGMGFQERSEAFDFQVSIQDWQKRQRAPKLEASRDSSDPSSGSSPHIPAGPKRDFSLKEGETISVKLGGVGAPIKEGPPRSENAGGAIPLLTPPPSSGRKR